MPCLDFIRVHHCSNWTKWWTKHVPRNMEDGWFPEKGLSPNQPSLVLFVLKPWLSGTLHFKRSPYLWIIGIPVSFLASLPRMFHSTFQVYRIQTAMTTDSEIPTCYFNATFLFLLSELHTVLPWFSVKYPHATDQNIHYLAFLSVSIAFGHNWILFAGQFSAKIFCSWYDGSCSQEREFLGCQHKNWDFHVLWIIYSRNKSLRSYNYTLLQLVVENWHSSIGGSWSSGCLFWAFCSHHIPTQTLLGFIMN